MASSEHTAPAKGCMRPDCPMSSHLTVTKQVSLPQAFLGSEGWAPRQGHGQEMAEMTQAHSLYSQGYSAVI